MSQLTFAGPATRIRLRRVLFPALTDPSDKVALRFPKRALTYRQLTDAATAVAEQVERERAGGGVGGE